MSANSNQIKTLNNLITTLYDGENGYKEAAEEVKNTALATRFRQLAQQRYDFGHLIKPFITQFGGEVDKGGSAAASLHRVWMDLKTAVSGNDEEAVLNECIRGEESAVQAYAEALEGATLTGAPRAEVKRQMDIITTTVADLRKMANSFANA